MLLAYEGKMQIHIICETRLKCQTYIECMCLYLNVISITFCSLSVRCILLRNKAV